MVVTRASLLSEGTVHESDIDSTSNQDIPIVVHSPNIYIYKPGAGLLNGFHTLHILHPDFSRITIISFCMYLLRKCLIKVRELAA